MPMDNMDFLLHRDLKDGKEFEDIIPASECKKIPSGDGNTDLSMELIKKVSVEFSWQMRQVAKLIKKNTLEKTCIAIHDFAFWHFQYLADDEDQFLRSPACSWHTRFEGIDCKSYSIIASSILSELGMKHYIRKIKQPYFNPEGWTHVYVIVPKDQQSGSLKSGYFTIDGTIPEMDEPSKVATKDLYMNHFTLNRPASHRLNGTFDIKNYMSMLSCIGGTSYNETHYKSNVTKICNFFDLLFADINTDIQNKDFVALSNDVNEYFGMSKLMAVNFRTKRNEKDWNGCSGSNLDRTIDLSKFYSEGVAAALTAYLSNYFTKGAQTGVMKFTASAANSLTIWGLDNSTGSTIDEPKFAYTVKAGTTTIPKFEVTPYVAEKLKNPAMQFNLSQLLSGFSTVIASFGGGSNSGTGTGTGTGSYDGGSQTGGGYTQVTPDTKNAGFGLLGWGMVGAAAMVAFGQLKDKPSAAAKKSLQKPAARRARKTTRKK